MCAIKWKEISGWLIVFVALLGTSIVIGLLRVFGFKSEFYQAIAHVFVGGLFGAAIATGNRQLWCLGIGLTVVEVVVFLAGSIL